MQNNWYNVKVWCFVVLIKRAGFCGKIAELQQNGYKIRRNGISNYTLDKKSRIVFEQDIPDDTDNILTSKDIPSWKRMCYCLLKNDHTCRFMGFGLTRQEQLQVNLLKEKC